MMCRYNTSIKPCSQLELNERILPWELTRSEEVLPPRPPSQSGNEASTLVHGQHWSMKWNFCIYIFNKNIWQISTRATIKRIKVRTHNAELLYDSERIVLCPDQRSRCRQNWSMYVYEELNYAQLKQIWNMQICTALMSHHRTRLQGAHCSFYWHCRT